jgi:ribosome biogenesis protein UTP30
VVLPHNFRVASGDNVCLLVKDKAQARKELGEDYANQFGVKKIIDLAQLRSRYHAFQAKRELANEFDTFLADDRIVCMLPKTLGKAFYSTTVSVLV